jgi:hypothetical protein
LQGREDSPNGSARRSWVGEIVPSIEPLLDHSDAEIREAAEETLYFVDDSDPDEPGSNADSGTDPNPGDSPGSVWDR